MSPLILLQLLHFLNSNTLWAALFWAAIGAGYVAYGNQRKDSAPLIGGVVILFSCLLPGGFMTVASILTMVVVYWLKHQG